MYKQLVFKNHIQMASIITIVSEVGKKPNDFSETRILWGPVANVDV